MRCSICGKFPDILRRYCTSRRPPPITTKTGTRYRTKVLEEHLASKFHIDCVNVDLIQKKKPIPSPTISPMEHHISKANEMLADHTGKLMIEIYNDAKRLTLSPYSWPSRHVAAEAAAAFRFNDERQDTIPSNINLQHVNPHGYQSMLSAIVEADKRALKVKIGNCVALSIHVDGSIDRTAIDKIYILAKI